MVDVTTTKDILRKAVLARLSREPSSQPEMPTLARLQASGLFRDATAVVAYVAIQRELSLDALMAGALGAGKALFLPRFQETEYTLARIRDLSQDLVPGKYHIPEPAPRCPDAEVLPEGTLWLIPGIAFDPRGHRLGRGGGFYDRLRLRFPQGTAVGICRDCQLEDEVPADPWDFPVDAILTPTRWISSRHDISL